MIVRLLLIATRGSLRYARDRIIIIHYFTAGVGLAVWCSSSLMSPGMRLSTSWPEVEKTTKRPCNAFPMTYMIFGSMRFYDQRQYFDSEDPSWSSRCSSQAPIAIRTAFTGRYLLKNNPMLSYNRLVQCRLQDAGSTCRIIMQKAPNHVLQASFLRVQG
jgi:hypothetical protein